MNTHYIPEAIGRVNIIFVETFYTRKKSLGSCRNRLRLFFLFLRCVIPVVLVQ